MKKTILLSSFLLLLVSCDMIDYHPYDARIKGEKNINAKNSKQIEKQCAGKTTIRFVAMGDSQRWYDETKKFVKHLNTRKDIDFVIHGGDLSDFGATKEFLWMRDIMNGLDVPYVVLLGNHDCLGTGEDVFKSVFGAENFSFLAGNVRFICLNTNAMEYDYSNPVPDFGFIENEIKETKKEHEKTVVSMHAPPFDAQFNNNVARVFQHYITQFPNLLFCTNAHDHSVTVRDLFDDGIIYYGSACMKKRNYLLFTITPETYEYEVVYY